MRPHLIPISPTPPGVRQAQHAHFSNPLDLQQLIDARQSGGPCKIETHKGAERLEKGVGSAGGDY